VPAAPSAAPQPTASPHDTKSAARRIGTLDTAAGGAPQPLTAQVGALASLPVNPLAPSPALVTPITSSTDRQNAGQPPADASAANTATADARRAPLAVVADTAPAQAHPAGPATALTAPLDGSAMQPVLAADPAHPAPAQASIATPVLVAPGNSAADTASPIAAAGKSASPVATDAAPALPSATRIGPVVTHADGSQTIAVQLHPASLGRVTVTVERATPDATPHVVLAAEKPATLAMLTHDSPVLQQVLDQAGVPREGRSISFQAAIPEASASHTPHTDVTGTVPYPGNNATDPNTGQQRDQRGAARRPRMTAPVSAAPSAEGRAASGNVDITA